MKKLLLTSALLTTVIVGPAYARLQLSITANGSTFSCFDGELGCDQSGGANNLLVVNTSVGGAFVEIALAQSAFGAPDTLQLSSSSIINNSGAPITIGLVAGDTSFAPPIVAIKESGSLTFNDAVGSSASSLSFFADHANTQGANPLNTPGINLDTVFGTPATNPDSFSGSKTEAFSALSPFSMTESANLNLIAGGSITGFNESMQSTAIPEPRTWFLLLAGFGLMALVGRKARQRLVSY